MVGKIALLGLQPAIKCSSLKSGLCYANQQLLGQNELCSPVQHRISIQKVQQFDLCLVILLSTGFIVTQTALRQFHHLDMLSHLVITPNCSDQKITNTETPFSGHYWLPSLKAYLRAAIKADDNPGMRL